MTLYVNGRRIELHGSHNVKTLVVDGRSYGAWRSALKALQVACNVLRAGAGTERRSA